MPASFPSSIYNPRTKENRPGIVYQPEKPCLLFAEDLQALDQEVVAMEESLTSGQFGDGSFLFQTWFENIDNWVSTLTGGASNSVKPCSLILTSTGAAYSYNFLTFAPQHVQIVCNFEKSFVNNIYARLSSATNQACWFGPGQTNSVGLHWEIDGGTLYARASYYDYENEIEANVKQEITGITLTTAHRYKIVYTALASAKFYVDDVLVSTIDLTTIFADQDFSSNTNPLEFFIQNYVLNNARVLYVYYYGHKQQLA